MNTMELEALGLEEMNETQMQDVDGGWSWGGFATGGLVGGMLPDLIAGFADGWADGHR